MHVEGIEIHAISDTHNRHKQIMLPGGDILIHSGDATGAGVLSETMNFLKWFSEQDYSHLIFVPGNHDRIFEQNPQLMQEECDARGITLLNDSGVTVEGIKIWGSPVQPWFYDWAFNRHRGPDIQKHWDLIPTDTEILITHGPAHGILDYVPRHGGVFEHVGCTDLLKRIYETQIKLHVFGHIHYAAGYKYVEGRTFVNAAMLGEDYRRNNLPPKRIIRDIIGEYFLEDTAVESV